MKTNVKPPYLGVAYYPEDWDESEQLYDIAKMKEAGINVARIAEFAWHKMEPKPGEFDFSWLHRVVDRLTEAGIAVVLGTPTATPPRWLIRRYPDVVTEKESGRATSHGGRRHCCSNNEHYRFYSARIVEAMVKEFADEPGVIGWQIDNEIYAHGMGCFCPNCQGKFAEYLEKRYGTIEALNAAWNLNLFSQAYDCFEEVPAPRDAWHNPHLKQEWITFQNESHVDFVHMQADILHRYVKVPVGTDIMPLNGINYRELNKKMDVVQFNHYQEQHNLWTICLWFDHLRPMMEQPFWNTETQTCWNGSETITQSLKPDGFCRVNSFLPLALGGEANMYWLWRTHWAGHELIHGSVLDSSGRPMHIFREVQDVAELMDKAGDFLTSTRVDTPVAMHYTSTNWNMWKTQQVVKDMDYAKINEIYQPIVDQGLRPDVIDAEAGLDKYKLLFSPLMLTMEEGGMHERVAEWVKAGGVWVVGPLSDIRSSIGTRYQHKPFGMLEELTGAKWLYGIPDRIGQVSTAWADGESFRASLWYDVYDEAEENTLIKITAGHSAINGKACVVHRRVGRGHVILLGTLPAHDEMMRIVAYACGLAGVACGAIEGEIMVSPRRGDGREGVVLVEHSGKNPAAYKFDGRLRNVVTGEVVEGSVELEPYGIAVLEKI
ncbi:MAG: beta-galactosidase [Clostridia bacterium]|nr:beta-galactosidase [Clostridia bacterium]